MREYGPEFEFGVISVKVAKDRDGDADVAPDKAVVSGDFLVNARTGRLVVVESDGTLASPPVRVN